MGSPDLPNEENDISRPAASSLPMHGGNTTASDDSDVDNIEAGYVGYQPLSLDEETMEYRNETNEQDNDDDDADDDFDYSVCNNNQFMKFKTEVTHWIYTILEQAFNAPTVAPETGIVVPSIDAEIEGQVWNAPRPESTNIVLDSTRTEQVVMM